MLDCHLPSAEMPGNATIAPSQQGPLEYYSYNYHLKSRSKQRQASGVELPEITPSTGNESIHMPKDAS